MALETQVAVSAVKPDREKFDKWHIYTEIFK